MATPTYMANANLYSTTLKEGHKDPLSLAPSTINKLVNTLYILASTTTALAHSFTITPSPQCALMLPPPLAVSNRLDLVLPQCSNCHNKPLSASKVYCKVLKGYIAAIST